MITLQNKGTELLGINSNGSGKKKRKIQNTDTIEEQSGDNNQYVDAIDETMGKGEKDEREGDYEGKNFFYKKAKIIEPKIEGMIGWRNAPEWKRMDTRPIQEVNPNEIDIEERKEHQVLKLPRTELLMLVSSLKSPDAIYYQLKDNLNREMARTRGKKDDLVVTNLSLALRSSRTILDKMPVIVPSPQTNDFTFNEKQRIGIKEYGGPWQDATLINRNVEGYCEFFWKSADKEREDSYGTPINIIEQVSPLTSLPEKGQVNRIRYICREKKED